jgi:hypothetical protein
MNKILCRRTFFKMLINSCHLCMSISGFNIVKSVLGLLHRVGDIADVSEIHASSIFGCVG